MSDTSSFAEYNVKDELVLFGQGMFLKLMTSPCHVTCTSTLSEHPYKNSMEFTRKPLFSQGIWKPFERPYKIREEIWSKSRTSTGPMEKAV